MRNDPVRAVACDWLATAHRAVLVEVTQARGSAPREAGTRMLVASTEVVGTIGGGHLEWKAIAQARALLVAHPSSEFEPEVAHYPLGPMLGQCCGGAVSLRFSLLNPEHTLHWPLAPPRFFLQMYGAGHVGRAIARLLADIDCTVDWIDEREDEFPHSLGSTAAWPTHIRKTAVDTVEAEVATAPPGAFYLVLTHQHDLDWRITKEVLKRADFGYLGLIGSDTKRAQFFRRFERHGVSPKAIARITCPIGIPGVTGKEPEIIAVAAVAQLLQRSSAGFVDLANEVSLRSETTHRPIEQTASSGNGS